MAVDLQNLSVDLTATKEGLLFDTNSVMLLGAFLNEIAAYRTRRTWVNVLNTYFLLEKDRDYSISIITPKDENHFLLNCSFTSACGRYAFWRLINHQAPEAQEKLSVTDLTVPVLPKKSHAHHQFLVSSHFQQTFCLPPNASAAEASLKRCLSLSRAVAKQLKKFLE